MFLVDISPSMGNLRIVELPGDQGTKEVTSLEWALQFVKLKIQEMVRITRLVKVAMHEPIGRRYSMDARRINVVLLPLGLTVRFLSPLLVLLASFECRNRKYNQY